MEMAAPNYLARIELTLQPERVFYKDEGGMRWYYLYCFFCVRGKRTTELKHAFDRASDGRRKIPIDCTLLYDGTLDEVEDQTMLTLLSSSKAEGEVSNGTPEFDPQTGTGSVRYRVNKVSMRKDNQGFRLKLSLRGLENVVEPVITESTVVLSKRKKLRKSDREPEQQKRDRIEAAARKRNLEVAKAMSNQDPVSTPLIHRILSDPELTQVPEFPELLKTRNKHGGADNGDEDDAFEEASAKRASKKRKGSDAAQVHNGGNDFLAPATGYDSSDVNAEVLMRMNELSKRVSDLENHVKSLEAMVQMSAPSYNPAAAGGDDDAARGVGEGVSASAPGLALSNMLSMPAAGPKGVENNKWLQESLSMFLKSLSTNSLAGVAGATSSNGETKDGEDGDQAFPSPAPVPSTAEAAKKGRKRGKAPIASTSTSSSSSSSASSTATSPR